MLHTGVGAILSQTEISIKSKPQPKRYWNPSAKSWITFFNLRKSLPEVNITLHKLCLWLIWLPNYLFRFSEWGVWGGSDGELPHLFVGLLTNDQYTLFLVGLLHIVGWWDFERQHKVWTAHCLCCSHRLEGGQRGCLECCLCCSLLSDYLGFRKF